MFFPPKRQTIIAMLVAIAGMAISTQAMAWQNSEFERRAAAMLAARARSSQAVIVPAAHSETVSVAKAIPKKAKTAATSRSKASVVRPHNPRSNERVASTVVTAPPFVNTDRKPAHVAQLIQGGSAGSSTRGGQIIQGGISGSSTRSGQIIQGGVPGSSTRSGQIISNGPVYENVIHDEGFVGESYIVDDGYVDGGIGCDVCSTGFESGSVVSCDDGCCGRGGCPGGCGGPCWLGNLGRALRTGEYFGGVTGFQSPLFTAPGQDLPIDENVFASDSSFGAFGGFNLGIPLCRLSNGFLSGQFGLRSVNTNFNGNEFTDEERRQLFITTGLYRRVDQGFQFGVVADILHEEWFTESDLVQVRGDLSWVYPSGHVFGFRYATNVQDEETEGTFDGNDFFDFLQTTDDNYRFYYRRNAPWGGWGEAFFGWADAAQTIIGLDVDVPVTEFIAFQSNFTAFLNDDLVPDDSNFQGGNQNEAWSLSVGISFRPQGRGWYRSYDRPFLPVADNGTFVVRRESPEIN